MGRRTIPFLTPFRSMASRAARMPGGISDSRWTEIRSAPASAKASMYRTGFSIMRWTSRNMSVAFRRDLTTGGPMVMLETNIPSITSTWSQSAVSTRRISPPRSAKSAERIEGAILTIFVTFLSLSAAGQAGIIRISD